MKHVDKLLAQVERTLVAIDRVASSTATSSPCRFLFLLCRSEMKKGKKFDFIQRLIQFR